MTVLRADQDYRVVRLGMRGDGDISRLVCLKCPYSVNLRDCFRHGDRSGQAKYNRARGRMVRHIHAEHPVSFFDPKVSQEQGHFEPLRSGGSLLDMQEVRGSSPLPPTTLKPDFQSVKPSSDSIPVSSPSPRFRPHSHPKRVQNLSQNPGAFSR